MTDTAISVAPETPDTENDETNETESKARKLSPDELVDVGFKRITVETEAGADIKYPLTYHIATDDDAGFKVWQDYCEKAGLDFQVFVAKNLNSMQTQRATQGGKNAVRDAKTPDVRDKKIAAHQAAAFKAMLGKPRERAVGGLTKSNKEKFGAAIAEVAVAKGWAAVTPELLEATAKQLGIDPALIAQMQQ